MYEAQQVTRLAGPGINLLGSPVNLLGSAVNLLGSPINLLGDANGRSSTGRVVWGLLAAASLGASVYHGVKRHGGSIGWGLAWGAAGAVFPVVTPAIAAAQGYGKCKYDCRSGTSGGRWLARRRGR